MRRPPPRCVASSGGAIRHGVGRAVSAAGTTRELSAGPPWFWGDKNPLAAFVGQTVTIAGMYGASGTELDVGDSQRAVDPYAREAAVGGREDPSGREGLDGAVRCRLATHIESKADSAIALVRSYW